MKVSVIVPVKNEAKTIGSLLDNLLAQDRKPDEIVITDGGSVDGTCAVIDSYIERGAPIVLIREKEALPGRGRNIAIARARHEVIAMTDAGIVLGKDWLRLLVRGFETDPQLEVVYGVQGVGARSLFEKCFAVVSIPKGIPDNGRRLHYPYLGSMAIRRHVWKAAGGFREDLRATEDILFFRQLERSGCKHSVEPDAVAYWKPRSSLREAASLSYKYAECDAYAFIHARTYFRKFLTYAVGLFLLYEDARHPVLAAVIVAGFLINVLLTCKKHWKDFAGIVVRQPQALLVTAAIIVTVDLWGMAGFFAGLFKRRGFNAGKEGRAGCSAQ